MKKIGLKALFSVFIFFTVSVCTQAQTLSWEISFTMGIQRQSLPILRQIQMETGDLFQIAVKPDSGCFFYIVYYGAAREITVLYNAFIQGGTDTNIGAYNLTEPSGVESIFVIASLARQVNLENLIQSYNSSPGSQQHANNLYREIMRLQTAASELGEPASSFITGGGTSRTAAEGSAQNQVTRFSGKALYVRAITIRH